MTLKGAEYIPHLRSLILAHIEQTEGADQEVWEQVLEVLEELEHGS